MVYAEVTTAPLLVILGLRFIENSGSPEHNIVVSSLMQTEIKQEPQNKLEWISRKLTWAYSTSYYTERRNLTRCYCAVVVKLLWAGIHQCQFWHVDSCLYFCMMAFQGLTIGSHQVPEYRHFPKGLSVVMAMWVLSLLPLATGGGALYRGDAWAWRWSLGVPCFLFCSIFIFIGSDLYVC